jgi:hypothetical protein
MADALKAPHSRGAQGAGAGKWAGRELDVPEQALHHRSELPAELAAESNVSELYRRAVAQSAEQSCAAPVLRQSEHSQLERTAKRMRKPTEMLREGAARLSGPSSRLEARADAEVARPPAFPLPEMLSRAAKDLPARPEPQKLAGLQLALGPRAQLLAGLLRRAKRQQSSLTLDELLAEQPRAAVLPL